MINFTFFHFVEIPENKVIVDIRPVFLRGFDGMLQCRFNGAPLAVFWLKGNMKRIVM